MGCKEILHQLLGSTLCLQPCLRSVWLGQTEDTHNVFKRTFLMRLKCRPLLSVIMHTMMLGLRNQGREPTSSRSA